MKITVSEIGELILEEIYTGVILKTGESNVIGICMRDDTFEINISNGTESNWWRVNMQEGIIERMGPKYTVRSATKYLFHLILFHVFQNNFLFY